jgi:hypothetical protein
MSEPFWVPLGGAGVDYKGDWAVGTQYQPGDVVRRGGVDYLAVNPSLGTTPPASAPLPNAMELIAEKALDTDPVFSAIPQTYDTLRLVLLARLTVAAVGDFLYLRVNGDTATTYDWSHSFLNNNGLAGAQNAGQDRAGIGVHPAASAISGAFGTGEVLFPGYSLPAAVNAKSWFGQYQGFYDRSVPGMYLGSFAGWRYHGDPITSLSLLQTGGGALAAGSRAWLYGLRGA